jgi:tetratricopeptide (TPR) repeat protein
MSRTLLGFLLFLLIICLAGCKPVQDYAASAKAERLLGTGARYLFLNDYEKAQKAFQEAADLRPSGDVFARIGLSYHMEMKLREALPRLEKAFEIQPSQPWAIQAARAAGYAANQQPQQAQAAMNKALEEIPDDPFLLNNIAYPMADAGLLLDDTIVMLKKAVAAAPHEGIIVDSLGWAYFRQGRYEDARDVLLRAATLSPDSVIRGHLAEAQKAVRKQREERKLPRPGGQAASKNKLAGRLP